MQKTKQKKDTQVVATTKLKAGNSARGPTTNKVKSKHTASVASEDEQDPDPNHELRHQVAKVFY